MPDIITSTTSTTNVKRVIFTPAEVVEALASYAGVVAPDFEPGENDVGRVAVVDAAQDVDGAWTINGEWWNFAHDAPAQAVVLDVTDNETS